MNPAAPAIAPVLILSTGRCGSTMISDLLNRHPQVLSLSEFFVPLGPEAFAWANPDGERLWRTLTRQSAGLHAMLKSGQVVDEALYRFDAPGARFGATDIPPIMAVTLPHLSDRPEELLTVFCFIPDQFQGRIERTDVNILILQVGRQGFGGSEAFFKQVG